MTSALAVIVPMKSLHLAKQRLRPALTDAERLALARAMLRHVLDAVIASKVADLPVVISPDPLVLTLARRHGFAAVYELQPGYNPAVRQALGWAQKYGAAEALILPADLPQLTPADLHNLLRLARDAPRAVVIAPDAAETGTNALFLRPPGILSPSFGEQSCQRHQALARAAGLTPLIYHSPTLAHDVDIPADLVIGYW